MSIRASTYIPSMPCGLALRLSTGRIEHRPPIDVLRYFTLHRDCARALSAWRKSWRLAKRWMRIKVSSTEPSPAQIVMTRGRYLILASMFLVLPGLSLAADPDAGRTKAEPCLACHFSDDFVGESEPDILLLIEATRAAGSEHPGDDNGLSETDLADIAAFLARGE